MYSEVVGVTFDNFMLYSGCQQRTRRKHVVLYTVEEPWKVFNIWKVYPLAPCRIDLNSDGLSQGVAIFP